MARRIDPITGEIIDDTTLAEEAITAEEGEEIEGPTPERPFFFTEQALNPRAEAVRGRAQRDPRGRSRTGLVPGSQGQFDLAAQFGLTDKDLAEIDDPRGIVQTLSQFGPAGEPRSEAARQARRDFRSQREQLVESGQPFFRQGETRFSEFEDLNDPILQQGVIRADLSDRQAVFRAFRELPEEIRQDFPLQDPRRQAALARAGSLGPQQFNELFSGSPAEISERIRDMQPSKGGGNLTSRIGKAIVGGGLSILGGIAGGPLGAGVASGLFTGADTGFSDLGSIARSAGMAAGAFGIGNVIRGANFFQSGLSQAAGQTVGQGVTAAAQQNAARLAADFGTQSIGGGFSGGIGVGGAALPGFMQSGQAAAALGLGAGAGFVPSQLQGFATAGAGVGGATGGTSLSDLFGEARDIVQSPAGRAVRQLGQRTAGAVQGRQAQIEASERASELAARSSAQARGLQRGSVFAQRLPDNPFFDPVEDLESVQGDLI